MSFNAPPPVASQTKAPNHVMKYTVPSFQGRTISPFGTLIQQTSIDDLGLPPNVNVPIVPPVLQVPPVNDILPGIVGNLSVGSILAVSNGTWENDPTSFNYQWMSALANVGTNTSTYTTVSTDISNNITCQVTAINAYGSTTVTSAAFGPITS